MTKQSFLRKTIIGVTCFLFLAAGISIVGQNAPRAAAASSNKAIQTSLTEAQKKDAIVSLSKSLMGKVKYKFGVNKPSQYIFDCSSFTKYVFASQGIKLKWGTKYQSKQGVYVAKSDLQVGDLIFLSVSRPGKINHVGIYIGDGKFIHNTIGRSVNGLLISDLNSKNYSKRYITARRVS